MSLSEIYKGLILEGHTTNSTYLAKSIGTDLDVKLGIDGLNNPVLLISEDNFEDSNLSKSNYRLNYLEILFNQFCSLKELGKEENKPNKRFTTIRLIDGNSRMIEYYLSLLEVLIIKLKNNPTFIFLNDEIGVLIDLFSTQKPIEKSVVLGLWGELFFIKQSQNISESVKAWHSSETNIFDFTYLNDKCIEIKTTIKPQRIHEFSQKQIEKYKSCDVAIASIITQTSGFGVSIKQLWDEITEQLTDIDLKSKLTRLISTTLKSDFQALYDYKFNIELARSTLKYIDTHKIPSLKEELHPSIRNVKLTIQLDSI